MDKINSLNNIVEIFRSKLQNKATSNKKTTTNTPSHNPATLKKLSRDELENSIKLKIKQLDTSDNDFKNKANIILIENILSWEFGYNIQQDPDFSALREKIKNTIHDNSSLNNDLNKLIDKLMSQ